MRSYSRFRALVLHLARRQLDASHRMTVLGWAWPLARQLAQLAVLVFIFSRVFDSEREHFPVFVFTGLIAWSWFAVGLGSATSSLLDQRHLLFQPRFPSAVLPMVSVAVPLVDVLMALPVLVLMVVLSDSLHWTILLLPLPIAVQLLLMSGVAWLTASASVFYRDVPNLVAVALTLLFYLTPVFYSVPDAEADILHLNPLTTLVETWRALVLGDPYPGVGRIVAVAAASVLVALAGRAAFARLQPRLVDEL